MPTWLGFAWTAPNTLLGLLIGLFTFQRPRLDGAVIFDERPRGLTALMPRLNRTAMTIGFVIVSAAPVEGTLAAHERHHIKQYSAFGRTADDESLTTVRAIGDLKTGNNDRPAESVIIKTVTVTESPKK